MNWNRECLMGKEHGPAKKCKICNEYKIVQDRQAESQRIRGFWVSDIPEIGCKTYVDATHVYEMVCDDCAKKVLEIMKGNQDAY